MASLFVAGVAWQQQKRGLWVHGGFLVLLKMLGLFVCLFVCLLACLLACLFFCLSICLLFFFEDKIVNQSHVVVVVVAAAAVVVDVVVVVVAAAAAAVCDIFVGPETPFGNMNIFANCIW